MKRILAGLIGGVALTALVFGTAMASDDEYYEHRGGGHEAYEHGGYANSYGYNNGYNTGYRNHELREYGGRYTNSAPIYGGNYYGGGYYVDDDAYKYNNYGYNNGYRNHEMCDYGR